MNWMELDFGRYKGDTLPQVIFKDPDWFFWAIENEVFDKRPIKAQAYEIYNKARRIKVPPGKEGEREAEFVIHPIVKKVGDLNLVPKTQPQHVGGSQTIRKNFIDLNVPRQVAEYDKTAIKCILPTIKYHLFGDSKKG